MKYPAAIAALLREGTAQHHLVFSPELLGSNLQAGGFDPRLAEADVAFGQLPPEAAVQLPRLKWVHLSTAGYERYDRADLRAAFRARSAMLTTSSSVYNEPCAEHALAMMLSLARGLGDALHNQQTEHGWPCAQIRERSPLLTGQTALLLGFGAIARRLVELLAPFRMELLAVRRTVRGDEPIAVYPQDEVDRLLPLADHVINVLPGGEGTALFMSAARLARMRPTAIFYNIGRGQTVDQAALLAALREKRIAAAYLDVTTPEPLPPEHPLWTVPNCFITPHTAGGHTDEFQRIVRHFLANLERFTGGRTLLDRVI
jgi:phosphoglycerate dehydrogenase-like enzyme